MISRCVTLFGIGPLVNGCLNVPNKSVFTLFGIPPSFNWPITLPILRL